MDSIASFHLATWGHYITMLPADWSISISHDPFAWKMLWNLCILHSAQCLCWQQLKTRVQVLCMQSAILYFSSAFLLTTIGKSEMCMKSAPSQLSAQYSVDSSSKIRTVSVHEVCFCTTVSSQYIMISLRTWQISTNNHGYPWCKHAVNCTNSTTHSSNDCLYPAVTL